MALPFPQSMPSLLLEAHVETRWRFGKQRQRGEWSRRVSKRRLSVFSHLVLPVHSHAHWFTDRLWLLSSIIATEVTWSAKPKILSVSGPLQKNACQL